MHKKQLFLPLLVVLAMAQTQAMEQPRTINPETLMSYLPPMQTEQEDIVKVWTEKNSALLTGLSSIVSFRGDVTPKNALLKEHELSNKSVSANFVFEIPGSEFIAKIAGTCNKRANFAAREESVITQFNGLEGKLSNLKSDTPEYAEALQEWFKFQDDQYEIYSKKPTPFSQGISRAETSVRLRNAIENQQLTTIYVADTQIIPFHGTESNSVSDQTHFVIEQIVPDMKTLAFDSPEFQALSPNTIVELLKAIQGGYLWDMGDNIGIRADNKTLVLFDLEQPNRFAQQDSFLGNKPRSEVFATQGMDTILTALKEHGTQDQLKAALEYVRTNEELRNFEAYQSRIQDKFLN